MRTIRLIRVIAVMTVSLYFLPGGIHAGYEATGYLYKDGIPQGTINPPAETGPAVRFAIDELSLHLEQITGRKMLISYREAAGEPGITLTVKKEYSGDTGQDFTIFEDGKKITITGNSELALLYGVYQYLDELGVRWYAPGELGTDIPRLKDIPIRRDRSPRKYSPSTLAREIDYSASWRSYDYRFAPRQKVIGKYHHEHDLLALRNRQHFARPGHNGHFFSFNNSSWGGSHGITSILRGVDIRKEPERFALVPVNGELRRSNDFNRVQICFTNEKNVDAAVRYIKDKAGNRKSSTPEYRFDLRELTNTVIPLGLGDCKGFCQCENCEKTAGTGEFRDDRLVWSFINKVAKRMQKEAPGKMIGIFAPYSMNMKQPPPDVKLEKNIFAQACRTEASLTDAEHLKTYPFNKEFFQNLSAIRTAGAAQGNYDYFLYKTTPTPLALLDAAKVYHETLEFHSYHIEIMQLNAQTYAYCWAIARYLWDDKTDPRKNLEEYCKKYYGDAAGTEILKIMKFYDLKERGLERVELGSLENTHMILPDSVVSAGRQILKNAQALAETPKHRKRVQYFIYTFESQAQAAEIYRAVCRMLNSRTAEDIAVFMQTIRDYETFWANPEVKEAVHPETLTFVRHFVKPYRALSSKTQTPEPAIAPAQLPNSFPLPEIWKFRIDWNNAAEKERWFEPGFDDSKNFQPVSVFDIIENQGYPLIDGHFCYRVRFNAPRFPAEKKIYLRFGGIDDRGKIYVNGILAGETKITDWDNPCVFEVTQMIRSGQENQITVLGHDSYGGAGIWRGAVLYTD